ncbi:ShET2/EspL2 family type III secretion system effector toxin [Pokkaliibacter sp. CJK22405]|uniref:ShET2/EspL2 family type III secretion system effector toxin n=1 Tax=Pokkaliibacter sp. CJK22405 TaxID=3384615 RepID=UPI0039852986
MPLPIHGLYAPPIIAGNSIHAGQQEEPQSPASTISDADSLMHPLTSCQPPSTPQRPKSPIPEFKRHAYESQQLGDPQHLNGQLQLKSKKYENELNYIYCRHLAVHYLYPDLNNDGPAEASNAIFKKALREAAIAAGEPLEEKSYPPYSAGRDFLNEGAASLDKLREYFSDYDEAEDRTAGIQNTLVASADGKANLLTAGGLGNYLADAAQYLRSNNKREGRILLLTATHAMAVHLQSKDNDRRITASFYDPNITNKHRRIVTDDIESLRKLTMAEALPFFSHYTQSKPPAKDVTFSLALSEDIPPLNKKTAYLIPDGASVSDTVSPHLIEQLVNHKQHQTMKDLAERMKQDGITGAAAVPYFDTSPNATLGATNSLIASQLRFSPESSILGDLCEMMRTLELPGAKKADVLTQKCDGQTPLESQRKSLDDFSTLRAGNPDFARYLKLLDKAGLPMADVLHILRPEQSGPVLQRLMDANNSSGLTALFDLLKKAGPEHREAVKAILDIRTPSGDPAYYSAMEHARTRACDAYLMGVCECPCLNTQDKQSLLRAEVDGFTALGIAVHQGNILGAATFLGGLPFMGMKEDELGELLHQGNAHPLALGPSEFTATLEKALEVLNYHDYPANIRDLVLNLRDDQGLTLPHILCANGMSSRLEALGTGLRPLKWDADTARKYLNDSEKDKGALHRAQAQGFYYMSSSLDQAVANATAPSRPATPVDSSAAVTGLGISGLDLG